VLPCIMGRVEPLFTLWSGRYDSRNNFRKCRCVADGRHRLGPSSIQGDRSRKSGPRGHRT